MDPVVAHHYIRHFLGFIFVVYALSVVLWGIPLFAAARKAGLHYTVGLLPLIGPLGSLIAVYILAFSQWKTPQA